MPGHKIIAVLNDLMFTAKIQDAAKRVGLEALFVKSVQEAVPHTSEAALVVVDLNDSLVQPLDAPRLLRNANAPAPTVIGFISHVETERRREALEAGYDEVLPRSTFSQKLPAILDRFSSQASSAAAHPDLNSPSH